ncbi:MAG: DNA polymerase IV [FCB group bacterium]|nr:DNA polymerase IV [FCB group bacterium]
MPQAIIHLDLDAFFCSVECLKNPDLKGIPIVVGGSPDKRGVVAAASYPARKFGIRSAMPMARAVQLCPDLVIVPHHFGLYKTYSRVVMGLLKKTAPVFRQNSIDEALMDFTDRIEAWEDIIPVGKRLQRTIRNDIGLPASLGIGPSRIVAKIASDFEKPNGFTVVPPGEEEAFLGALAVSKIPGIGPRTAERLAMLNIRTVYELRQKSEMELTRSFGKLGHAMWLWARGRDSGSLNPDRGLKSASRERTFATDINNGARLETVLSELCVTISKQLQKKNLVAGTVSIKLRDSRFNTRTRQMKLNPPRNEVEVLERAVLKLFREHWEPGEPLRLIGAGCGRLQELPEQLGLGF